MGIVGEFNKNLKELEKITEQACIPEEIILIKSTNEKNEIVKKLFNFSKPILK